MQLSPEIKKRLFSLEKELQLNEDKKDNLLWVYLGASWIGITILAMILSAVSQFINTRRVKFDSKGFFLFLIVNTPILIFVLYHFWKWKKK